jgi:methylmalonyl-CoA mutase, N-terminal domain
MGGVVKAIENGYQQGEIAEAAARYQREIEEQKRYIVNVNIHEPQEEDDVETHSIDEEVAENQLNRLKELKERRDNDRVQECLQAIKDAAESGENTMYPTIEAVRAYATVQEICDAMKEVYGSYRETPVI